MNKEIISILLQIIIILFIIIQVFAISSDNHLVKFKFGIIINVLVSIRLCLIVNWWNGSTLLPKLVFSIVVLTLQGMIMGREFDRNKTKN